MKETVLDTFEYVYDWYKLNDDGRLVSLPVIDSRDTYFTLTGGYYTEQEATADLLAYYRGGGFVSDVTLVKSIRPIREDWNECKNTD